MLLPAKADAGSSVLLALLRGCAGGIGKATDSMDHMEGPRSINHGVSNQTLIKTG